MTDPSVERRTGRRILTPALIIVVAVVIVAGIAAAVPALGHRALVSPRPSASASGGRSTKPDTMRIVRLDATNAGGSGTVWTIRDPAVVMEVYSALTALPVMPKTVLFCPMELTVHYRVTFTAGERTVLTAAVSPTGCREVVLRPGGVRWAIASGLPELARATGLSECEFIGRSGAGCPPAP